MHHQTPKTVSHMNICSIKHPHMNTCNTQHPTPYHLVHINYTKCAHTDTEVGRPPAERVGNGVVAVRALGVHGQHRDVGDGALGAIVHGQVHPPQLYLGQVLLLKSIYYIYENQILDWQYLIHIHLYTYIHICICVYTWPNNIHLLSGL